MGPRPNFRSTTPLPYGTADNTTDTRWIFSPGRGFIVDLRVPVSLDRFRIWSVLPTAERAAVWEILSSDDGSAFTHEADFNYDTSIGGGVDDPGAVMSSRRVPYWL